MVVAAQALAAEPASDNYLERWSPPVDHEHHWVVHWKTVPSFDALAPHSDLVIRGRVVSYRGDVIRSFDPQDPSVYSDAPITISTIRVDDIVSRSPRATAVGRGAVAIGSLIEVQDIGGLLPDGCIAHPEGKPLMRRDEDVVLFLSASPVSLGLRPGNGGRYAVVGGFQGRFNVVDGKVVPLAKTVDEQAGFFRQEGRNVNELLQELKRKAAKPQK